MPRVVAVCVLIACRCFASASHFDLGSAVELLDSPSLAEREQALLGLISDDSLTLSEVERLLADGSLTPEQRCRLEGVGLLLFMRMPRAGLGVQFGSPSGDGGAPLAAVIPNFPAAGFLKPGDIVYRINGEPVANREHMGSIILSHAPGQTLRLEIGRPTGPRVNIADPPPVERLVLDVPLGRFEDLNSGQLSPARIESAYQQRLARAGVVYTPPMIGSGISPLAWLRAEGYDALSADAPSITTRPGYAGRSLSFGGQPVSSVSEVELRRGDERVLLHRSSAALRADGEYGRVEELLGSYRALVRRLAQIRSTIDATPADELGLKQEQQVERARTESRELMAELENIIGMLEDEPIRGADDQVP